MPDILPSPFVYLPESKEGIMLVLSRKVGESVCIGENIYVRVVSVEGGRVKLSFDCPLEIPIHREEVRQRILKEVTAATRSTAA